MRRFKNLYSKLRKLWDKARLEEEKELKKKYGLKSMREIWRAEAIAKRVRVKARGMVKKTSEEQKNFINGLFAKGFVRKDAVLEDVLALDKEKILERRLQTIVYKKGLARTPKHARQLIVHSHIMLNGKKVNVPGYLVKADEEDKIELVKKEGEGKKEGLEEIKKIVTSEMSEEKSDGVIDITQIK